MAGACSDRITRSAPPDGSHPIWVGGSRFNAPDEDAAALVTGPTIATHRDQLHACDTE